MNNAKSYKTALLSLITLSCSCNAMLSSKSGKGMLFSAKGLEAARKMQEDRQEAERIYEETMKKMQEENRQKCAEQSQPEKNTEQSQPEENLEESTHKRDASDMSKIGYIHARLQSVLEKPKNLKIFPLKTISDQPKSSDD